MCVCVIGLRSSLSPHPFRSPIFVFHHYHYHIYHIHPLASTHSHSHTPTHTYTETNLPRSITTTRAAPVTQLLPLLSHTHTHHHQHQHQLLLRFPSYRHLHRPTHTHHLKNMAERKAVIKNADMSEDMQQDAVDCASQALDQFNIEKDIAAFIKKEFDKKYNPTWHCIVGRNFGSYVTHETKHFIYFYLGQVAILLFKSG